MFDGRFTLQLILNERNTLQNLCQKQNKIDNSTPFLKQDVICNTYNNKNKFYKLFSVIKLRKNKKSLGSVQEKK